MNRRHVMVDYNLSPSSIYRAMTGYIFEMGCGLELLTHSLLHGTTTQIQNLPSWAPDFSAQSSSDNMRAGSERFRPPYPRSVSGENLSAENGHECDDLRTLEVEALTVDTVDFTVHFDRDIDHCIA